MRLSSHRECELAYRLGMSENIDAWEPTEQGADIIEDISSSFHGKSCNLCTMYEVDPIVRTARGLN
jgi:hypothetical protein